MTRKQNNKKQNATTTRRNAGGTGLAAIAKTLGLTTETLRTDLEKACMTCTEHDYSVAKDKKRKEYILKDANGHRITIRGHKDSYMLISNKEILDWEKHARKTGTWWGKALNAEKTMKFIADMTHEEVQLG